jgi:hypothetical protein
MSDETQGRDHWSWPIDLAAQVLAGITITP